LRKGKRVRGKKSLSAEGPRGGLPVAHKVLRNGGNASNKGRGLHERGARSIGSISFGGGRVRSTGRGIGGKGKKGDTVPPP